LRNAAEVLVWQVWQMAPGSLARRRSLDLTGLWIEWQERQLTAAEFEWNPVEKEACSSAFSWQERHSCAPSAPWNFWIRLASPPASMCLVPSPWQLEQTSLASGFFPRLEYRA